jgi:hypothetical protein
MQGVGHTNRSELLAFRRSDRSGGVTGRFPDCLRACGSRRFTGSAGGARGVKVCKGSTSVIDESWQFRSGVSWHLVHACRRGYWGIVQGQSLSKKKKKSGAMQDRGAFSLVKRSAGLINFVGYAAMVLMISMINMYKLAYPVPR